mgnify:CR=1 FL=1|jgi:hypothetical protein
MDNNALLLLAGAKKIKQTIGVAGQQGFGVGVYGGDPADLTAMGLAPMEGCKDPTSDNYGNYKHTNGSIMCCVPAFCYRLGNSNAPSYYRDGDNALEIKDASEFPQFAHNKALVNSDADFGNGWLLHRAFVDGGKMKNCFFMDKYLCSNNGSGQAASIKNADWLMCFKMSVNYSTTIFGGAGANYDAITFSRARGDHYSLTTVYQWSAMAMLSLAHGQAATSTSYCAWYDPTYGTNFPKGATTDGLTDIRDSSIMYTAHAYASTFAKTGSSNNAEKVSHNGQLCGIMDVAGMCNQLSIGATNKTDGVVGLMKLNVSAHDFTLSNRVDDSLHEAFSTAFGDGAKNFSGLRRGKPGTKYWASCGVIPINTSLNVLFGENQYREYFSVDGGLIMGLGTAWGTPAGVFCRSFKSYNKSGGSWVASTPYSGFRTTGYAP